jgi:hypothetical protein
MPAKGKALLIFDKYTKSNANNFVTRQRIFNLNYLGHFSLTVIVAVPKI